MTDSHSDALVFYGVFCSECRQLLKYRTVELRRAPSVQHLKPGHQIALLKAADLF